MTAESPREPLFAGLSHEATGLIEELRALGIARWRLLRLELLASLDQVKRLVILCAVAFAAIATSLPVLVVAAGDALAGVGGIPRWGWLLIFAATLILGAILTAWLSYRRFRRNFTGVTETLEELREDVQWLRELRGSPPQRSEEPITG
jgi:Zn-dependent protease with chaperone function